MNGDKTIKRAYGQLHKRNVGLSAKIQVNGNVGSVASRYCHPPSLQHNQELNEIAKVYIPNLKTGYLQ